MVKIICDRCHEDKEQSRFYTKRFSSDFGVSMTGIKKVVGGGESGADICDKCCDKIMKEIILGEDINNKEPKLKGNSGYKTYLEAKKQGKQPTHRGQDIETLDKENLLDIITALMSEVENEKRLHKATLETFAK